MRFFPDKDSTKTKPCDGIKPSIKDQQIQDVSPFDCQFNSIYGTADGRGPIWIDAKMIWKTRRENVQQQQRHCQLSPIDKLGLTVGEVFVFSVCAHNCEN